MEKSFVVAFFGYLTAGQWPAAKEWPWPGFLWWQQATVQVQPALDTVSPRHIQPKTQTSSKWGDKGCWVFSLTSLPQVPGPVVPLAGPLLQPAQPRDAGLELQGLPQCPQADICRYGTAVCTLLQTAVLQCIMQDFSYHGPIYIWSRQVPISRFTNS